MQSLTEQRKHRRYNLFLPVLIGLKVGDQPASVASSLNISASGIYFIVPSDFELRSELEFELVLPKLLTQAEGVRIECRGTIIRVEQKEGEDKLGVAVRIDKHRFVGNVAAGGLTVESSGRVEPLYSNAFCVRRH